MMNKAKILVIGSAILMLLAFFLPWLSVSVNNRNILNRSGLELAQGRYDLSERLSNSRVDINDDQSIEQQLQGMMDDSMATMIDLLGLPIAEGSLYLVPAVAVLIIVLSFVSSWKPSQSYGVLLLVLSGLLLFYLGYKVVMITFSDTLIKTISSLVGLVGSEIAFESGHKIGFGMVISGIGAIGIFFGGFMVLQSFEEDKRLPQLVHLVPGDLEELRLTPAMEERRIHNAPGFVPAAQPVPVQMNPVHVEQAYKYPPAPDQTRPYYAQTEPVQPYYHPTYPAKVVQTYPEKPQPSRQPGVEGFAPRQHTPPTQPQPAPAISSRPQPPQSLDQTQPPQPPRFPGYPHQSPDPTPHYAPQPINPNMPGGDQPGVVPPYSQTVPPAHQPGGIPPYLQQDPTYQPTRMPASGYPVQNPGYQPQRNPIEPDYPPDPQGRPVNNWRPLKLPYKTGT